MSLSFSTVLGTQRRFGAAAHEAPALSETPGALSSPGPEEGLRPSPMRNRSLQLRQRASVPGSPLDALRCEARRGGAGGREERGEERRGEAG